MIGTLWGIIVGTFCRHEWETVKSIHLCRDGENRPVAFVYHLQCKKCGNMKSKVFRNE